MKKNLIQLFLALSALAVFGLAGCGGGGGGSSTPAPAPTPSTTTFSTAKLFPTVATDTTYYTLSGSDNRGGTWTGSWSQKGDGSTTFEGRNVTKLSQQITLSLVGGSSASSSITGYYNADRSLYKTIYTGSTSGYAIQTNSFTAPASFKIGDSITGPSLTTYLNNTTDYSTSTYQVTDAGGGNAKVTAVVRQASGTVATTEQVITPAGDMVSMRMVISYTNGLTVTLSGSLSTAPVATIVLAAPTASNGVVTASATYTPALTSVLPGQEVNFSWYTIGKTSGARTDFGTVSVRSNSSGIAMSQLTLPTPRTEIYIVYVKAETGGLSSGWQSIEVPR